MLRKPPSPERVTLSVDGRPLEVAAGTTVAVALLDRRTARFRTSPSGEPRGPLCAMGTCHECRVTIDGVPHRRSCLELCRQGMVVETSIETAP
jgi:sarcosine oxidase subunit alpha